MKNHIRSRWVIYGISIILVTLSALGYAIYTFPFKFHDEQGIRIAGYLKNTERIEAYYTEKAYLSFQGWREGSKILIYGVSSKDEVELLVSKIRNLNLTSNVWLEFYSGTHDGSNSLFSTRKIKSE